MANGISDNHSDTGRGATALDQSAALTQPAVKSRVKTLIAAAILMLIAALMLVGVAGCGGTSSADASKPLDLTGQWVEKDHASDDMTIAADITSKDITVNWKQEDGTTALYWKGSYDAPKVPCDSYSWVSKAAGENSKALLASQDSQKTFNYKKGVLSFKVTALGITRNVQLVRSK